MERVTILSIDARGRGVARDGRQETIVADAFPGELVLVQITGKSQHHPRRYGALEDVLDPSEQRRRAPCGQHPTRGGACDGCALMELHISGQHDAKTKRLADLQLYVDRVEGGEEFAYRRSSKRVVFEHQNALMLGSHRAGSAEGADMEGCLVEHPLVAKAFAEVQRAANELGLQRFDGQSGLRSVWSKTDGLLSVTTLVMGEADEALARELATASGLEHVSWSSTKGESGSLRGKPEGTLIGEQSALGAYGFEQPNPEIASRCYDALLEDLPVGPTVDLYAGSGTTTARLLELGHAVRACDVQVDAGAQEHVESMTSLEMLQQVERSQARIIVANPPRKGLTADVCQAMLALQPEHIRVMSCGPEGLKRDLDRLTAEGHYEVTSLRAFDTLPQTPHVELVVALRRRPG